jgi:hypothetical protein
MVDRDIEFAPHCLDLLYNKLKNQPFQCAYAYASFRFTGHINIEFPARPWDINQLVRANYISSNSMVRSNVSAAAGLVTDEKFKRLLDWCFWLKLSRLGFYGVPVPEASFVAHSTASDISAGSREDYIKKHRLVIENFVM